MASRHHYPSICCLHHSFGSIKKVNAKALHLFFKNKTTSKTAWKTAYKWKKEDNYFFYSYNIVSGTCGCLSPGTKEAAFCKIKLLTTLSFSVTEEPWEAAWQTEVYWCSFPPLLTAGAYGNKFYLLNPACYAVTKGTKPLANLNRPSIFPKLVIKLAIQV